MPHRPVKVYNDKAENQAVIERRLVGQLGDHFQDAQLIELSRNSYLIQNRVRLPILGQQQPLHERNKETISRKGFQQMKDLDFYSSRRLNEPYVSNLMDANLQKYVLDPRMRGIVETTTQKSALTSQDYRLVSKGQDQLVVEQPASQPQFEDHTYTQAQEAT